MNTPTHARIQWHGARPARGGPQGIETVRRDSCPAVCKLLEASLRILFATSDLSQVGGRRWAGGRRWVGGRARPVGRSRRCGMGGAAGCVQCPGAQAWAHACCVPPAGARVPDAPVVQDPVGPRVGAGLCLLQGSQVGGWAWAWGAAVARHGAAKGSPLGSGGVRQQPCHEPVAMRAAHWRAHAPFPPPHLCTWPVHPAPEPQRPGPTTTHTQAGHVQRQRRHGAPRGRGGRARHGAGPARRAALRGARAVRGGARQAGGQAGGPGAGGCGAGACAPGRCMSPVPWVRTQQWAGGQVCAGLGRCGGPRPGAGFKRPRPQATPWQHDAFQRMHGPPPPCARRWWSRAGWWSRAAGCASTACTISPSRSCQRWSAC